MNGINIRSYMIILRLYSYVFFEYLDYYSANNDSPHIIAFITTCYFNFIKYS